MCGMMMIIFGSRSETSSKRSDQGFFQGMGRSCFSCIIILDVFNTLYIVLVLKKVVKNPATSRILRKNPAGTGFLKYWRSGAGLSGVPEFRYTPSDIRSTMIPFCPHSQRWLLWGVWGTSNPFSYKLAIISPATGHFSLNFNK